ncbi:hypothetical protein [Streptomyces sp. MAR4 CNX-425]|uniref:hypothetical protein n=1 Tax=Streptomyces sp. MAR4 CNX-425 TaxID=3406343 RepID=UPI003B506812
MRELRAGYRVHGAAAFALCLAGLVSAGGTLLPGAGVMPRRLVLVLIAPAVPVFVVALIRYRAPEAGLGRERRLAAGLRSFPRAVKPALAVVVCLVALGLSTVDNGGRQPASDDTGYTIPGSSPPADLTRAEYDAAMNDHYRLLILVSALLYASAGTLTVASTRARPQPVAPPVHEAEPFPHPTPCKLACCAPRTPPPPDEPMPHPDQPASPAERAATARLGGSAPVRTAMFVLLFPPLMIGSALTDPDWSWWQRLLGGTAGVAVIVYVLRAVLRALSRPRRRR